MKSSFKTGKQRRTNKQKLKRTQTNLAVRRAISDQTIDRYINAQLAGMSPVSKLEPRIGDVRVSHTARYKLSRWQRVKNWFRNVFGRRSAYPDF